MAPITITEFNAACNELSLFVVDPYNISAIIACGAYDSIEPLLREVMEIVVETAPLLKILHEVPGEMLSRMELNRRGIDNMMIDTAVDREEVGVGGDYSSLQSVFILYHD